MSGKEWVKEGVGKGLRGLGAIAGLGGVSAWTILIGLIIIGVLGIFFWAFLHVYGLVTAFVGFIAGMVFLWFLSHIVDLSEHTVMLLLPIILGVLGYIVEHFNIWSVPLTVYLPLKAIMFASDVVISLDTLLLFVIAVCVVIQLIITVIKKK